MISLHLGIIFATTLTISVIISSAATWGLTYSTSYEELRDMSSGFVGLATTAVDEFRQLTEKLIYDSSAFTISILRTDYNRSMAQMNQTEQELLQTTVDLMAQTKNATFQAQSLVGALVVSFGTFMQSAIAVFTAVGTGDASRLRTESASRAQLIFNNMLQNSALAIKRTARLYNMGMLNLSRSVDEPLDDGSCTLVATQCSVSEELGVGVYIGTVGGVLASCDEANGASNQLISRGQAFDTFVFFSWPSYDDTTNIAIWKQACLASTAASSLNITCSHGEGMLYPNYCNGTCGYDTRCRSWYSIHVAGKAPVIKMSDVYPDAYTLEPVVTLSYPIYSASSQLLAVTATDFYLSSVDAYLGTLSASQLVAVVFNTSDLLVMGTSRQCPNAAGQSSSGKPLATSCDPALQALGGWLAVHRNLVSNTSLELSGYLWDVFPGTVESFSYFVVVGMNKMEVYSVVTATSQAANQTLQALSQQQTARMAETEAASLAQMERLSASRIASLQLQQADFRQYIFTEYVNTQVTFNASRQHSAATLNALTSTEMDAVDELERHHLSKMKNAIGVTFGAVVGIFAGVLICASYGTWAVTKQVQQIAQVMEDLAHMKVEQLEVKQKSSVREVQRIEAALEVLVRRLAEYKSYMPAGLFQAEDPEPLEGPPRVSSTALLIARKQSVSTPSSSPPSRSRALSMVSSGPSGNGRSVANSTRLMRRTAAVMAVNVVRFRAEAAQRPAGQLEGLLNKAIAVVHGVASKAQGNIDAIVGDQLLVTFNAHFACSDPSTAATNAALDVVATLKGDTAFPWQVQIGLTWGVVYAGHLGNSTFKSMVALGAPMKVASLLSHLSGFDESTVLVCPSLEERIKYAFRLQPADLLYLPMLGEHHALYAKSITVFVLVNRDRYRYGSQEWLYEVGVEEDRGKWAETFAEVTKVTSLDAAAVDLQRHLGSHPHDVLALRLLRRLPQWRPRVGIVLAERPDLPRLSLAEEVVDFKLLLSEL